MHWTDVVKSLEKKQQQSDSIIHNHNTVDDFLSTPDGTCRLLAAAAGFERPDLMGGRTLGVLSP